MIAKIIQWLVAIVLLLPIVAIGLVATGDTGDLLTHLITTRLPAYIGNTLLLMFGVGVLASVFGITTAWIILRYEFPLRRLCEWMLVLPAAVPAYLVAYTYTDFFEYAGPVQSLLRSSFGWQSAQDYWFPQIRSMGGAMLVMASVLYPYIYVTARTAFRMTSSRLFEVAILAGHKRLIFLALPLARAGIVAGLALVLMEVISDFGTVEYFAIDTITLGIFNVWLGMNNLVLAAQLAMMAMVLIVLLLWLENKARKARRIENIGRSSEGVPMIKTQKLFGIALLLICLIPIGLGFFLPVSVLSSFAVSALYQGLDSDIGTALFNTLTVAFIATTIIMLIAFYLGAMAHFRSGKAGKTITSLTALGYAFPGTILAIGVLSVSGYADRIMREIFASPDFIITGSFVMLLVGYIVRFQATGYGTTRSGLLRLPPNILAASQVMGHGFIPSIIKIVIPLMRPSLLAGFLLAFVDIMKELPMALLLRPFNFETLATITYQYAHLEQLEDAALPALIIVIAGLVPVIVINHALGVASRR